MLTWAHKHWQNIINVPSREDCIYWVGNTVTERKMKDPLHRMTQKKKGLVGDGGRVGDRKGLRLNEPRGRSFWLPE